MTSSARPVDQDQSSHQENINTKWYLFVWLIFGSCVFIITSIYLTFAFIFFNRKGKPPYFIRK
jgi:succinate-acetate transporter protein